MSSPGFPVPVPDRDTQPFWDAAAARRLVVPRCSSCGKWIWQPKPICPACHAPGPAWAEVSGTATVASWTVVRPPVLAAFAELVPFVLLLVELEEGVRLVGQLVDDEGGLLRTDGATEGVAIGAPVSLRWHDQDGTLLPAWTIAS